MKKALISGQNGQDGSYLCEFLLNKGYKVHGIVRRHHSGYGTLANILHLIGDEEIYRKRLFIHSGDLGDATSIYRIVADVRPDEIYNLAAQADVQESFLQPDYTVEINGNGVIRFLEAIKSIDKKIKFYQASTSELFGRVEETPQNENSRMNPQSPYAWGKFVGYRAVKIYREAYGLFASNGILFNHESPRRGDDYVTRKITKAVARIKLGKQKILRLGNLDALRDWGYSPEYCEAMWNILQLAKSDDFVIGTGETHSVKEWLQESVRVAELDWGDFEKNHLVIDPKLFRPAEVDILRADYSKAKETFGFTPRVKFKELVNVMVKTDILNEKGRPD